MEKGYLAVYSSSSDALAKEYFEAAWALGSEMAKRGWSLVFGAGRVGLMGECARAIHASAAPTKVYGVIPEALNQPGIPYERCDELVVTKTMRERKQLMEEAATAFIALPGGFGTLEEVLEILTLKQLRYHKKAIVLYNTNGFYDDLLRQFDRTIGERFAKEESRKLYFVTDNPGEALDYIESYQPYEISAKWLTAAGEKHD